MNLVNLFGFTWPISHLVQPDLVTVVVEPTRDGKLAATCIGPGRLPPNSSDHTDMDALVSAVDKKTMEMHHLNAGAIAFQYAWYPWGDHKKSMKVPDGPNEFLIFEVRHSTAGYDASLGSVSALAVTVSALRDLPEAIRSQVEQRWPSLAGQGVPGMIHWNRKLTPLGFVDVEAPSR